jgi:hypothetical protein
MKLMETEDDEGSVQPDSQRGKLQLHECNVNDSVNTGGSFPAPNGCACLWSSAS